MSNMEYREIFVIAIKKQLQVTNEDLVINRTKQVDGLNVSYDETLQIEITGDPKEVLADLVDSYSVMMGNVAPNIIAAKLKSEGVDKEKLPESLSQRY